MRLSKDLETTTSTSFVTILGIKEFGMGVTQCLGFSRNGSCLQNLNNAVAMLLMGLIQIKVNTQIHQNKILGALHS